jgi:hypothetical protein
VTSGTIPTVRSSQLHDHHYAGQQTAASDPRRYAPDLDPLIARQTAWRSLPTTSGNKRDIGNKLAIKHIKIAQKLMDKGNIQLKDRDLAYLSQNRPEFHDYLKDLLLGSGLALLNSVAALLLRGSCPSRNDTEERFLERCAVWEARYTKDCLLLWDARRDTASAKWIPVANIWWKLSHKQ